VGCGGSSTTNAGSAGDSGVQAGAGGTGAADAGQVDGSAGTGGGNAGTGGSAGTGGVDAGKSPSLAGTEFWAVDLPNERGTQPVWDKRWAVVLHNVGSTTATISVEQNDAAPGAAPSLSTVKALTLAPDEVQNVVMPTREVTGQTASTAEPPGPPMTELSSNAFRITSDEPLLAYQQNPWSDASSNDGTPLRPTARLGTGYRVLGLPTANPVAIGPAIPGIPDHSSVTIVGVKPGTTVKVTAGADLLGNTASGIAATSAGGTLTMTLGPFDTLNLSSTGSPGDLTGTLVEASQRVAVFSSGERVLAPFSTFSPALPTRPGYDPTALCCIEHFEMALPPVDAAGGAFVVPKSPLRSSGGYVEPDLVRVVATQDGTQVTTSLPAPMNHFTLQAGEAHDAWSTKSFTVSSSGPVLVAEILVSHAFTTKDIGDPSVSLIPDVSNERRAYAYVAPPAYSSSYVVLVSPHGNTLTLDGVALPSGCTTASIGQLASTSYDRTQCQVSAGAHHVIGTQPFALFAYGYSPSGSYAIALPGN